MTEQLIISSVESSVARSTVNLASLSLIGEELSKYSLHTFGSKRTSEALPEWLYSNDQDNIFDYLTQLNAHLAINGVSTSDIANILNRNNDLYTNSGIVSPLKQHVTATDAVLKDNVMALLFVLRLYLIDFVNAVSKRKLKEQK